MGVELAQQPRPSAAERERVARRLRGAAQEERLSPDTFASRLELVYRARSAFDLEQAVADLPAESRLARAAAAAAAWVSRSLASAPRAWREARSTQLVLPLRQSFLVGRSRSCDLRLGEPTVSRRHALLSYVDGCWRLRDLASTNGTTVNGARVADEVEVRPGDVVCFGPVSFRLAASPEHR